jgi:hypothetical protein
MNNGLRGQYGAQLRKWNEARRKASLIVAAYTGNSDLSDRLNEFGLSDVAGAIKKKLFSFGSAARDKVDNIARVVYYSTNGGIPEPRYY